MPRGALLKPRQEIGRDQGSLLRHVRLWHQDVMELQETAFQGMRGLPARRLRTLWTMLTHVHGSLLNVSDLARSLAVSSHTITGDLDVLEAAYMIRRLPS